MTHLLSGPVAVLGSLIIALSAPCSSAQSLPDKTLVGYWHNWGGPVGMPLSQVASGYDVVNVAFAIPSPSPGAAMTFTPDPGLYPNPQDFLADVVALQAQGTRVQISIGGAAHPVHVDTPADAVTFASSMASIVSAWGFDGLDIDLEGSSLALAAGDSDFANPTSPRIVHFISGINQLLATVPAGFSLTAAPETAFVQGGYSAYGGIWGAYLPVLHALRHDLDLIHVQHYNTGSMFGRDGVLYTPGTADFHAAMADMLIAGFPLATGAVFPPFAAEKVAIGLPASTQAAGSGHTAASIVHDALDLLILGRGFGGSYALADPAGYPRFRGLMTWSANWDAAASGAFSGPHRSYLDEVFLESDVGTISTMNGGTAQLAIRGGAGNAGRAYYLIAGISGTTPGVGLGGGVTLPINPDALTVFALSPAGSPFFSGFAGALDGAGEATASISVPPLVAGVGVMHVAWFLPFPLADFASPARAIAFVP